MKRARFKEDQIIGVLKEHEAGAKMADLARKHGVSEATLYQLEGQVRRHGCPGGQTAEAARGRERQTEEALAATAASPMSRPLLSPTRMRGSCGLC